MQEYNLNEVKNYYTNFIDGILDNTDELEEINLCERVKCAITDTIIGLGILEKEYRNDAKNEGKIIQEYKSNEVQKYYIKFIRDIINNTDDADLIDYCYRVFIDLIFAFDGLAILENRYLERAYDESKDNNDEELDKLVKDLYDELENEFFKKRKKIPGYEFIGLGNN